MRALVTSAAAAAFTLTPIASATAAPAKKPVATAQKRVKTAVAQKKRAPAKTTARATTTRKAAASSRTVARAAHPTRGKRVVARRKARAAMHRVVYQPAPRTIGYQDGLRHGGDRLDLASASALVIDQETGAVLYQKNPQAVLPIASLSKLMTGLIIATADLPPNQPITITEADVDMLKHSSSRLAVGTTLTRREMLHLALMASENRAAHALARTFPGGLEHFVALMNARAQALGMTSTHYVEPTGLNSENRSTAHDLALLVAAAYKVPLMRELTTSPSYEIETANGRMQTYHSTNGLIRTKNDWHIGLQKTGFINEAGHCMVLQTNLHGREVIMVFLDSQGSYSRIADARRVRSWVERQSVAGVPVRDATAG